MTFDKDNGQMCELHADIEALETQLTREREITAMLREALERANCDEVINHEGSGMFNKHDLSCRKCQALAREKEMRGETIMPCSRNK